MNGAISWMTKNHVASNLLMFVFIIGGIVVGMSVKQEVFPEIELDRIQISVPYPGAGPEEVEEGIVQKIEETIAGIDGIKEVKSIAGEGYGRVTLELLRGEDPDDVLQDVKAEVDRITTFPEDSERPVVSSIIRRREVVSLVVYGEMSERSLRELVESVQDDLLNIDGITQVDLDGVRPYEITVEVSEENLRRYGLTLGQVASSIKQASVDLPGGVLKTEGGEILIRTKERRYTGPEYEEITILARADGTSVKLGEIATVIDSFEQSDTFAKFDGQPAAMVRVYRVGDQTPIDISAKVNSYIDEREKTFPETVKMTTWNDRSDMFKSRRDLLIKNATIGIILVILTLGLFLEVKLALWVMLGIPISFLGTFLLMPATDVSINMISLFAFIMALGIVVDDAIVVGENIYSHRQMGKPFLRASIDGAIEVAQPVLFAILTSITAFLPLVFVSGTLGKFIKVIPLVVILILIVSLFESLFVLPAHLAHSKKSKKITGVLGPIENVRKKFGLKLEAFVAGPFSRILRVAIKHRYTTIAMAVAIFILAIGIVMGGIVKFRFMPSVDGDTITVALAMPPGTPIEITEAAIRKIERKGREAAAEFDAKRSPDDSLLRHIYQVVGGTVSSGGPAGASGSSQQNVASLRMLLIDSETRGVPAAAISKRWRELVGDIPGADSLTFASNLLHMGANIDVKMAHKDFTVLSSAAEQIKEIIGQYPGVTDIEDNFSIGKRELKMRLTPEARSLGITEESLGRQVRAAFYGTEALRLQRGRNELKVMVRYPEAGRESLVNLDQMRIRTPNGGEMPLSQAAIITEGTGFSSINRTDRKRVVNVVANVDNKVANAEDILADLELNVFPKLRSDYPGLSFDLEGENKERKDSFGSMKSGFLMAMLGIYALLAIPFRSYSQPLLIMAAIPFGVVGAVLGHLVMGYDISMLSIFGTVALSGVVVNDSLLIIDFINRHSREGKELHDAVVEAASRRFRPILLTSLTTFFGLAPMIIETSVQAQFLIPMAISLGFGILFATGITLVLIPSLYLVLEDIRKFFGYDRFHGGQDVEVDG